MRRLFKTYKSRLMKKIKGTDQADMITRNAEESAKEYYENSEIQFTSTADKDRAMRDYIIGAIKAEYALLFEKWQRAYGSMECYQFERNNQNDFLDTLFDDIHQDVLEPKEIADRIREQRGYDE